MNEDEAKRRARQVAAETEEILIEHVLGDPVTPETTEKVCDLVAASLGSAGVDMSRFDVAAFDAGDNEVSVTVTERRPEWCDVKVNAYGKETTVEQMLDTLYENNPGDFESCMSDLLESLLHEGIIQMEDKK